METLSEEILLLVVSFLPLKEAVRTSVLSTSWGALWRPCIVNVNLDSHQIMQVIGKFLHSCDIPQLLRLFYDHDDSSCRTQKMKKKPDLLAAKGLGNQELYLDFSNEEREKEAYALKLNAKFRENYSKHPSNFASFASLKRLHLKSLTHIDTEFSSILFSNCEFLECLKLEQCCGLRSLNVSSFNLKSFTYRGVLPLIKVKNSPNLIDVTLDISEGLEYQNEFDCEEILSLLESLRNVETLSITGWLLEWLCLAGVIFQRLDFGFTRLKKLNISEPCMNKSKLDSLGCFLDICPSLEKLYIDIDHERKYVTCPYFYHYWHEPYFGMENSILKPKTSSTLESLRVIEVTGFEIKEYDLLLLDILLKRALLLSSIAVIFKSREDIRREVIKFPLNQLRIASRKRMIVLSPNKDYYLGFAEV